MVIWFKLKNQNKQNTSDAIELMVTSLEESYLLSAVFEEQIESLNPWKQTIHELHRYAKLLIPRHVRICLVMMLQ